MSRRMIAPTGEGRRLGLAARSGATGGLLLLPALGDKLIWGTNASSRAPEDFVLRYKARAKAKHGFPDSRRWNGA